MKIQDYIHFYMGCECKNRYGQIHNLTAENFETLSVWGTPILRPLDSMTDDECEKYGVDSDGGEYYYGSISSDCTVGGYHHVLNINRISEIVRELCKDGFDCFGLIDAGLAIDATKLTTPVK